MPKLAGFTDPSTCTKDVRETDRATLSKRSGAPIDARDRGVNYPKPSSVPPWYTAKLASHASTVMYANRKLGQRHERVSRLTTASVLMHWHESAKKTISERHTSGVKSLAPS